MEKTKTLEMSVGLFLIFAIIALIFLIFKVTADSGARVDSYYLEGYFDDISGLKKDALIAISGVPIGRVSAIQLSSDLSQAGVFMRIERQYDNIPIDSTAKIMTHGILGSKYIEIDVGFEDVYFENGDVFEDTQGSLVLEKLISKLISSFVNK